MDSACDVILARFSRVSGMQFPNHDCSRCCHGAEYLAEVAFDLLSLPEQQDEAAAIFAWLAREVSPDTCVNTWDSTGPTFKVGSLAMDGHRLYDDINRRPYAAEIEAAYQAADREVEL